jgi:hypothetical protein
VPLALSKFWHSLSSFPVRVRLVAVRLISGSGTCKHQRVFCWRVLDLRTPTPMQ